MEFANFTAMDNIFTIKICENAIMNSKDQRVKALANLLIVIIKEFDKDLKNWSNENEITLTKEISIEQQKIENELFANKGVNFDYAFVDFLVINSKNRIEKYKEERSNGENSFFKSYTIKNIPILESNFIFYEEGATILK